MRSLLVPLLLGTVVPVSLASSPSEIKTTEPEACSVRAWVRAEDLSPDHVSRGELRIKVPLTECAHEIVSVTLRLQLDEFGEFKYLKSGAVLPAVQPTNQSAPDGYTDWVGSDIVYDYQAHDDGLGDPELWTVKAEERRAWTTEATLVDNNPDLSQPFVIPFTVAVPAVNYPPVFNDFGGVRIHSSEPVFRHSSSDLGYRYIAVVRFVDGHTEDVLAGHTTFVPSSQGAVQQAPFTRRTAFENPDCKRDDSPASKKRAEDLERCLPASQRSAFIAEIHLEEGNVVHQGQPLKGRVTVRNIKDGSTAISSISVRLQTRRGDHWAQAHADAGGDTDFYNATSGLCQFNVHQALNAESTYTEHIFAENDDEDGIYRYRSPRSSAHKSITAAHPYFDFELQIPHETPVDFASYYTAIGNHLYFDLTILYSLDVAKCINPDSELPEEEPTIDDATKTEEGLWDSYTRVGQPLQSTSHYWRSMTLQAEVAIIVVDGVPPAHPVEHYLSPGALAPVLRSGAQAQTPDVFPVAQPIFTEEALANTTARLMQVGSTDPFQRHQQFMNMTRLRWRDPHPTKDYHGGNYAGLLWKKKIVAEERGILPVVGGGELGLREGQQPFSAVSQLSRS
ncbi:hypothetical protein DFH08DRAFT_1088667 [Mycena albidolilacea]|uniref:Uncharacterized protein n=1 Tax=Mycena albidolilacea TaxID=1033008 RepID=A0AAD7EAC2_9AGAR|nr:hypothetical protein DFH08DRAFT_1088667 [Mycena albidolilacea]